MWFKLNCSLKFMLFYWSVPFSPVCMSLKFQILWLPAKILGRTYHFLWPSRLQVTCIYLRRRLRCMVGLCWGCIFWDGPQNQMFDSEREGLGLLFYYARQRKKCVGFWSASLKENDTGRIELLGVFEWWVGP